MKISLLGMYQPRNASVVLEAVDALRRGGMVIEEDAVKRGLAKAKWHARFEVISNEPLVIFDGAHNPQGIEGAVSSIERYFTEGVYVLTGVLRDKDYEVIAKTLARVAEKAFTITPDNSRALTAEEYAEVLREKGVSAVALGSISEAVSLAYDEAKRDGKPLVCLGSLYTYGDVTKAIREKKGI
jgi:dihydrofolate synthase/folylpolyglutamate synthase